MLRAAFSISFCPIAASISWPLNGREDEIGIIKIQLVMAES